jgi:hypothetical protein
LPYVRRDRKHRRLRFTGITVTDVPLQIANTRPKETAPARGELNGIVAGGSSREQADVPNR